MRIAVVHRSLGLTGGGERVCLSLLKALDRAGHDAALRCVEPPHGVRFAGGEEYPAPRWSPCDDACRASHTVLRSVRLDLAAEPGGDGPPGRAGLFDAGPGTDVLVVTDGGFVLERTDAPRVVLYCNAVLREEGRIDHLRKSRSPRARLRYWMAKRADRRVLRLARDDRVLLVPNSADTGRAIGRAVGRAPGPVVHPPVDLRRYSALRPYPKEDTVATVARYAPEKGLDAAARIMTRAGGRGRWEVVGSAVHPYQAEYHRTIGGMAAGIGARLRLNEGPGAVDDVLGRARVYLHASKETFGIAVAEAAAAGCVPVVPDNSAHPETVPFKELRYGTEEEAARIVREALDGRHDHLLPALRDHVQGFSEEAFQEAMIGIVEGRDG